MRPSFTHKKVTPLVLTEGNGRDRRMRLKAVNDNRAPLFLQLKKLLFTLAPISVLFFFAFIWWQS